MDELTGQLNLAALITRFTDSVQGVERDMVTAGLIRGRLELLERYWSKFMRNHDELRRDDQLRENPYFTEDIYAATEMHYVAALGLLYDEQSRLTVKHHDQQAENARATTSTSATMHLPKIQLPCFPGNLAAWESFRDLFRSMIHENQSLTPVQKLHYLKTSVQDDAKTALEGVQVTDANYKMAWSLLTKRYDNKRLLVYQNMTALTSMSPLKGESATGLQSLLDLMNKGKDALTVLGRPADQWDDWLVFFTSKAMDSTTRRDWERSLGDDDAMPTFEHLTTFVQGRVRALQAIEPSRISSSSSRHHSTRDSTEPRRRTHVYATPVHTRQCQVCQGGHFLSYCPEMTKLHPAERRIRVMRLRLCFNCLRTGHVQSQCQSQQNCAKCSARHHTFLHKAQDGKRRLEQTEGSQPRTAPRLETAVPTTHESAEKLGLTTNEADVAICGLGGHQTGVARQQTVLRIITAEEPPRTLSVSVYILRQLNPQSPSFPLGRTEWNHLRGIEFADPSSGTSKGVDVLLGADVYGDLILNGVRKGPPGAPVAQKIALGWVLTGPNHRRGAQAGFYCGNTTVRAYHQGNDTVSDALAKFWRLEEVTRPNVASRDDTECERLYVKGQRRDDTGRYIVQLPVKSSASLNLLKDTERAAERSLRNIHARMMRDSDLRREYELFMDKYEGMGHMQEVPDDEHLSETTKPTYYIPHHGIWKDADGIRKLRVVFNASRESPSGVSLNKLLHCGPALQNDLLTIIMRWRFHRVAFCTDIEMMYRQILVDPRDTDLQRIVWKKPQSQQLNHYRLLTVTYGMSCAPYLAMRTLRQLAKDEEKGFPIAGQILTQESYVDDILSGADNLTTAREKRDQLIGLLKAGGFHLRKWVANVNSLVHDLPEQDRLRPQWHDFQGDSPVKTLGVSWDPVADEFRFRAPGEGEPRCTTKREVLAKIARLFDPVGWLGPVIITAKILMQDLWRNKLDWDERLPLELARRWTAFEDSLPAVMTIRIPRWLDTTSPSKVELHGFADASTNAYAAAVYVKSNSPTKGSYCHLLTAKTRVSPVKVITIPRLELCAAVLLTRLLDRVSRDLRGVETKIHAWTDSRIVLAWIDSDPSRWSVFVSHRVAEIQGTLPKTRWRHVATHENPADIASRGTDPTTLGKHPLWWHGPPWLTLDPSAWPVTPRTDSDSEITRQQEAAEKEQRRTTCHLIGVEEDLISRFSSLTHLQRVIARCLRVREAFRRTRVAAAPLPTHLTPAEMETAYLRCVTQVQQRSFEKELSSIQRHGKLPHNSSLAKLNVFKDEAGILRVGGRLQEATLPYAETHPVILPGDCHLSRLIIDWAHRSAMHGGALLTYSYILRRAWIIGGKSRARQHLRKCVRCVQVRAQTCNQKMGNLPAERVTRARPFSRAGLDYAGPINVRTTKTGRRTTKGYLAIFVCLCTKAVHIEVVSDLTTASFLAAMRRFAGRRGTPREIWSDNATTFRGADNELRAMLRRAEVQWDLVAGTLANDGITWKFIPPSAPHFGGLWEAAVKSAKSHMKRVIGRQVLTFEELNTFVIQVEMCMNARPLTPLSGDLEDLEALTASHLLIGSALPIIPETVDPDQQIDRLRHWRLIQAMRDQFWVRWSREYLNTLQQRKKWTRRTTNLKPNDLVLIVDPSLLRKGRWPLGRVLEVYPGPDGLVRTAKIRTATGTYDRPIVKLCLLPVPQDGPTDDPGPRVRA